MPTSKRVYHIIIIAFVIASFGFLVYARFQNQQTSRRRSFEMKKTSAAMRGIAWLIKHKDDWRTGESEWYFKSLYKIAPSEQLAQELLAIAKANSISLPKIDTHITLDDKKYRTIAGLFPVVEELLRKKCTREEYRDDAETVKLLLLTYWDEIFPEKLSPTDRIVEAYLLKELGIQEKDFFNSTVSDIRTYSDTLMKRPRLEEIGYLYGVTHVVFAASDWFSQYLDPQQFRTEIKIFDTYVDLLSSAPELIKKNEDILSEILASYKLLRVEPGPKENSVIQQLIDLQNPDGSWGEDALSIQPKMHHTFTAITALLPFPSQFRQGKIYCP